LPASDDRKDRAHGHFIFSSVRVRPGRHRACVSGHSKEAAAVDAHGTMENHGCTSDSSESRKRLTRGVSRLKCTADAKGDFAATARKSSNNGRCFYAVERECALGYYPASLRRRIELKTLSQYETSQTEDLGLIHEAKRRLEVRPRSEMRRAKSILCAMQDGFAAGLITVWKVRGRSAPTCRLALRNARLALIALRLPPDIPGRSEPVSPPFARRYSRVIAVSHRASGLASNR
jgi:hypothetical protein